MIIGMTRQGNGHHRRKILAVSSSHGQEIESSYGHRGIDKSRDMPITKWPSHIGDKYQATNASFFLNSSSGIRRRNHPRPASRAGRAISCQLKAKLTRRSSRFDYAGPTRFNTTAAQTGAATAAGRPPVIIVFPAAVSRRRRPSVAIVENENTK